MGGIEGASRTQGSDWEEVQRRRSAACGSGNAARTASLETFKQSVTQYERAGATAYMNGEPNEWQRESMRAVDDAMRKGVGASLQALDKAWAAAIRDPAWWGQNALNLATAMAAGAEAPANSEIVGKAARTPRFHPQLEEGAHSPTVGGGLKSHEGGAHNGHTLADHLGKTEAQLRSRSSEAKLARDGKPLRQPPANSSFYNRAVAEANVAKAVEANQQALEDFMADPNARKLVIEHRPGGSAPPVGRQGPGPCS